MPRVPGSTRKQQAVIGWYRVDFLFGVPGPDGKEKRLVVEVDGHDFHERTKEQAAKDKARDRYMVDEGIEVRRYTGSEVWANPFGVAEEIIKRCHVLHTGMSEKRALSRAHMAEIARLLGMDSAA